MEFRNIEVIKKNFLKPLAWGVFLMGMLELCVHLMKWTDYSYWLLCASYFFTGYMVARRTEPKSYQDKLPYTILSLLIISWTLHINLRDHYPVDLVGIVYINVFTAFALLFGASVKPFRLYLSELKNMLKR